jgi:DNA-binding GntR family transcriptional regulator
MSASLTARIYGQIREDLIACRLVPGERLKARELSISLDVSLGVVREALSRLTAEGLVLAEAQRGYRARPLSLDELMELSEATISVETFCLRRAIEAGDLEWETLVTATHYRFANMPMQDRSDSTRLAKTFMDAYSDFRRALVSACANKWMLHLRETLHAQSERYRQACIVLGPRQVDTRDGYATLVSLVLQRAADAAAASLEERLKINAQRMREALQRSTLFTPPR